MITLPLLLAVSSLVTPVKTPLRWTATNAVLAVADFESAHARQHGIRWNRSHTHYTYCYESNGLYGAKLPRRSTFYTRGLALDVAVEAGSYLLSRKLPHRARGAWRFGFAAVSYWHAAGLASNLACE